MRCPMCNHQDSKIIDSNAYDYWNSRRRLCVGCGEQYHTAEMTIDTLERLNELLAAKQDIEAQITSIIKRKFYVPRPSEKSPA